MKQYHKPYVARISTLKGLEREVWEEWQIDEVELNPLDDGTVCTTVRHSS